MKKYVALLGIVLTFLLQISCSGDDKKDTTPDPDPDPVAAEFIRAADVSFLPDAESHGAVFYNGTQAQDMLTTLKNAGCNTIRIRLWKNPSDGHSNLAEVKTLATRVKNAGMKVWLTVHYSDTWADPGNQTVPAEWQSLSFTDLKTAVQTYTATILTEIDPDIFQIGNETNDGFLWPMGKLSTNESQYLQLVNAASATIRSQSPDTKIMLHFAGIDGSDWFFNKTAAVDFDYIGLSYYPIWHGKDLSAVTAKINLLGQTHDKKVVIAETAYPFSLGYNDYTNNVVGLDNQLIPAYAATPDGQKNFLLAIKALLKNSEYGQGFAYWGAEWVSFMGDQATNGSTWENQALYDFDNKAVPAMSVFSAE